MFQILNETVLMLSTYATIFLLLVKSYHGNASIKDDCVRIIYEFNLILGITSSKVDDMTSCNNNDNDCVIATLEVDEKSETNEHKVNKRFYGVNDGVMLVSRNQSISSVSLNHFQQQQQQYSEKASCGRNRTKTRYYCSNASCGARLKPFKCKQMTLLNVRSPLNIADCCEFTTTIIPPIMTSSSPSSPSLQQSCVPAVQPPSYNPYPDQYNSNKPNSNTSITITSSIETTNDGTIRTENAVVERSVQLSYASKRLSTKVSPAILLPCLPGCEPHSKAAKEMSLFFPEVEIADIVRFLIARKGDVKLAKEMMKNAITWHMHHFPLKLNSDYEAAIKTGCFFPHGQSKEGNGVLYFRGALYDNTKASAETFVLLAAHCIDFTLATYGSLNVDVFVHAVSIPGAPNAAADLDFIKQFIKVLSDNYPERLKRLIIYPFPWYGRAVWSVLKMFVDKRSQDKVLFLPATSSNSGKLPAEITDLISVDEIPQCCGGDSKAPIIDVADTFIK